MHRRFFPKPGQWVLVHGETHFAEVKAVFHNSDKIEIVIYDSSRNADDCIRMSVVSRFRICDICTSEKIIEELEENKLLAIYIEASRGKSDDYFDMT